MSTQSRAVALTTAVRLEWLTVVWMGLEGALAIGAGVAARSVVLTAFGADSIVELLSGAVLVWRLSAERSGGDDERIERVEHRASSLAGVLLVLLCAYVVVSSIAGLLLRVEPEASALGLAVAAAAVVGMPLLAWAKTRANRTLGSGALRADIAESITCAYMAGVTLVGVAVSMATGLWWVQYIAALALLIWLVPEAREAFDLDD